MATDFVFKNVPKELAEQAFNLNEWGGGYTGFSYSYIIKDSRWFIDKLYKYSVWYGCNNRNLKLLTSELIQESSKHLNDEYAIEAIRLMKAVAEAGGEIDWVEE